MKTKVNNPYLKSLFCFVTVIATLGLFTEAYAAKGGKGNPGGGGGEDPGLDGAACVSFSGKFPALVRTVRVEDGSSYDFFLTNSTGDCSVKVHTSATEHMTWGLSYSQVGTRGRIAWRERSLPRAKPRRIKNVLYYLEFEVVNKEVMTSLPLSSSILLVGSGNEDVEYYIKTAFSPDGNYLAFTQDLKNSQGSFDGHIKVMDLSNCSSYCDSQIQTAFRAPERRVRSVDWGSSGNRLYFAYDTTADFILNKNQAIGYISKQSDSWSEDPTVIIKAEDLYYSQDKDRSLENITVTSWDHDSDGVVTDNIAYIVFNITDQERTLEVMEVSGCTAGTVAETCSAKGQLDLLSSGIPGSYPKWTTYSSDPGQYTPTLIVKNVEGAVPGISQFEYDPVTGNIIDDVFDTYYFDPAD